VCGIVGAISQRPIVGLLVEGLKRLEYRGYDSCGVAVHQDGQLRRARSTSRVAELERGIAEDELSGVLGIAHTRWATHGAPSVHNAHPHFSGERIALVHNGIIENFESLRDELRANGYRFDSQTDTEVIAHLIDSLYRGDLLDAVRRALPRLQGAYALAAFCRDEPHRLVGARQGSPMVLGVSADARYLASDAMALATVTDQIAYLEEGDLVDLRADHHSVFNRHDDYCEPVTRTVRTVAAHGEAAELGPYRHYMQKEIFEQPRAIADTLDAVESVDPGLFGASAATLLADVDRVLILACGTSYYAGCTARYWLEAIAGIPTTVEVASEYRYRDSVPDARQLVVTISQSGETADTLAALKHARALGQRSTLTICNVQTSALVRECEMAFITRAGTEIGVASTKAFTTQLVALYLLTLVLAQLRGRLSDQAEAAALKALRHLPVALQSVLALEPQIIAWAESFCRRRHALFLGRGLHYPIALEGALKLKEISYIHAEAYPAGELKHGPLALVDASMPVVVVAPNDVLLEKLKSNMQEVAARGGELYVFADAGSHIDASQDGLNLVRLPEHYGDLSPILHVVPLQLLAYHTARALGTDVDKPRNLAKSVTVE
jgi:glucosamine--fructose-6-phosphate aminotransferase (isomerizing)